MVRRSFESSDALAVVGIALAILGTFLPWITAGFSAGPIDVSTAITGIDTTIGLVTALVAVVAAVLLIGLDAADTRGTATGLAGLVVILGGTAQLIDLGDFTGAGVGLYVSILGGVILAASGAIVYRST